MPYIKERRLSNQNLIAKELNPTPVDAKRPSNARQGAKEIQGSSSAKKLDSRGDLIRNSVVFASSLRRY
jgi:hypothetical protein